MTAFDTLIVNVLAQVPDSNPTAPGDLGRRFDTLVGYAKWLGLGICVLAMIAAGVRMAVSYRDGGDVMGGGSGILKVMIGVVVVVGAATLVGFMVS